MHTLIAWRPRARASIISGINSFIYCHLSTLSFYYLLDDLFKCRNQCTLHLTLITTSRTVHLKNELIQISIDEDGIWLWFFCSACVYMGALAKELSPVFGRRDSLERRARWDKRSGPSDILMFAMGILHEMFRQKNRFAFDLPWSGSYVYINAPQAIGNLGSKARVFIRTYVVAAVGCFERGEPTELPYLMLIEYSAADAVCSEHLSGPLSLYLVGIMLLVFVCFDFFRWPRQVNCVVIKLILWTHGAHHCHYKRGREN